jgi:hypothetical protein
MRNKSFLIGFAVCLILLLLAAVVLSANPQLRWGFAGSGGGQLAGSDRQLVSAIGPPVAGTVKNGYQLHSGLYLGNSLPGPVKNRVFLPSITSGHESAGGLFVSSIQ